MFVELEDADVQCSGEAPSRERDMIRRFVGEGDETAERLNSRRLTVDEAQ